MITAKALDFFRDSCPPDFWRSNYVTLDEGQLRYRSKQAVRDGKPETRRERIEIARRTQGGLTYVMKGRLSSVREDDFIIASNNVQAFHEAYPELPQLEHPTVLCRGLRGVAIRQLSYEFTRVERDSLADGQIIRLMHPELSSDVGRDAYGLENFQIAASTQLEADQSRLSCKYTHIQFLTRAAYTHVDGARRIASTIGVQIFKSSQIDALKGLHKAVSGSLIAVKKDLDTLQDIGALAASGSMQLKQATYQPHFPRGQVASEAQARYIEKLQNPDAKPAPQSEDEDYPIVAMRVPNLFGPGEMLIDTLFSGMRMQNLYDQTLHVVASLRSEYMRPRTSELATLKSELIQLLRTSSRVSRLRTDDATSSAAPIRSPLHPIALGPLSDGRLFERTVRQTRE